jgi:transcriptional regulator with XRE-family HTH domain
LNEIASSLLARVKADESMRDDLDDFIAESLEDPRFRAAFEDAEARTAALRVLVERRQANKLSQTAVAELMATTQSAVSEIEGGVTDPRISTLQRYARAVGCRLAVAVHDDWSSALYAGGRVEFGTLSSRPIPSGAYGSTGRYAAQVRHHGPDVEAAPAVLGSGDFALAS